jgi:undecaprenyl-diphosphatase
MDTLKILVLSFIQGATEILPVSSSGHLLLIGEIMDVSISTLILTLVQIGTTIAIIIFFRKSLFNNFLSKKKTQLFLKILVASIPAGIVGILLQKLIENTLRATWLTAVSLIVWGIVMIVVEKKKSDKKTVKNLSDISFKQAIMIGIAQTLALIPGTSRSGITTIAGVISGLDKYIALEFGLLLGIPVLLGSPLIAIYRETVVFSEISFTNILIIFLVPMIVGYLAIFIVSKFKKEKWLSTFGYYRIILGIVVLLLQYWV